MPNLFQALKKRILIMDGAMGTLLMDAGVKPEEGFDLQNLKHPDIVKSIHKKYIDAGADIIETNTFGANKIKLEDYKSQDKIFEINKAAVTIARQAAGPGRFVAGSIGPLGKFIQPLGALPFNTAVSVYAEQAEALELAGADVLSIETISDLQEMRAAIIGTRSKVKIPIIASMTYDENGLTVFGTSPEAAVVVLEALGADIISANCSTGPEGVLKTAKRLLAVSRLPIMVMPNAGMPVMENDVPVYKMTPEKFAGYAKKFAAIGVSIIGGCCGTSPQHISAVKSGIRPPLSSGHLPLAKGEKERGLKFASRTRVVEVKKGKFFAVGERINPTGRKALRDEIKAGIFSIVRDEAVNQKNADLLDVNVSVVEGNDVLNMTTAVHLIEKATDIPLCIDSPKVEALEAGLAEFCGRALVNSVNGKQTTLDKILPIAKKYGAAVIGLTLDEVGIPKTAEERAKIAEKIIIAAKKAGIPEEEIFIDNLVMTAGVSLTDPLEALKAIEIIKKSAFGGKVKTILGVSNVSHGLPNRSKINAIYLQLAILHGLDAGIVDSTDTETIKALKSISKIKNTKAEKNKLIEKLKLEVDKSRTAGPQVEIVKRSKQIIFKDLPDIKNAVIDGDTNRTRSFVAAALEQGFKPQNIIDQALTPGMEIVGARFSKKQIFLPQVLSSAESMTAGFELCKARIPKEEIVTIGKILVATVFGDIHDIGKNIVKMMLENHGFEVIDLGKDVPADNIIEAAKKHKPDAIALSALLTTTMLEMRYVKESLKAVGLDIPIIVGGAVVTAEYADKIDASYGADAACAVNLAKQILKASKSKG
ncbi:homocysteine S-methyltransferase family protein [Candidatus Saganbacteria bacterium]|nr:homocysteine S-methyltransferase family protein [Candidatus Saganbacteria bacterium]